MNKLDTIELWQLLTLLRYSEKHGARHDLTRKIEKEIFRRLKD